MTPKLLLRLEGAIALFVACIAFHENGDSWWKFAVLFLVPDLLMLGYLFGSKTGAMIYNLGHTYVAPFVLWLVVYYAHKPALFSICAIWVAHIGFDRLLGFGLKYPVAFKETHLQKV